MNQWEVPYQPPQRPRRRWLGWGAAGAAAGLLANVALLVLVFGLNELTRETGGGSRLVETGGTFLGLSTIISLALLITGGLLCIGRAPRAFGVGLMIGTGVGLIVTNGVCVGIIAVAG